MHRLLLDTHALLWWFEGNERMPPPIRQAIYDGEVTVSAASLWEIATKHRLGKLPGVEWLLNDVPGVLTREGFRGLPISLAHAQRAGAMAGANRDPFDRMLIAQAMLDNLTLVSNETTFDAFPVHRLW